MLVASIVEFIYNMVVIPRFVLENTKQNTLEEKGQTVFKLCQSKRLDLKTQADMNFQKLYNIGIGFAFDRMAPKRHWEEGRIFFFHPGQVGDEQGTDVDWLRKASRSWFQQQRGICWPLESTYVNAEYQSPETMTEILFFSWRGLFFSILGFDFCMTGFIPFFTTGV